jgi:histone acetyltransferase (RNA polymerase elongator complex component)
MKIFPVFIPNSGCPVGCVFCDQSLNSGVVQAPTPEEVVWMLEQLLPDGGIDQVAFYGGSFTALPMMVQDRYLQAVHPFLLSGQVGGIRLSTRPDCIDPEGAVRLRRSGVETVELGCQSFSDKVLAVSGRGCRAEVHGKAVRLLRDAGLIVGIQLMPGLPGGEEGEALDSLQKALLLKPDFVRVYPTVVLAGTRLAEDWLAGRYLPMTLEYAVEVCGDMALLCHEASVPILRFGLQASADLDSGGVLSGPYHPAFGQLVQSSLWLRAMTQLMLDTTGTVVQVHPHDLSTVLGQKRCNLERLRKQNSGFKIESCATVKRGQLCINHTTVEMMAFAAGSR